MKPAEALNLFAICLNFYWIYTAPNKIENACLGLAVCVFSVVMRFSHTLMVLRYWKYYDEWSETSTKTSEACCFFSHVMVGLWCLWWVFKHATRNITNV